MDPSEINPQEVRTESQTSYGALIAIVVIVAIVVVGAFYAWGKKVAEVHQIAVPTGTTTSIQY
jgi:hypothetical protein